MKVHGLGWLEWREPLLSCNVQVAAAGPEVVHCLLDGVLERPPGVADAQAESTLPAGGGVAIATMPDRPPVDAWALCAIEWERAH